MLCHMLFDHFGMSMTIKQIPKVIQSALFVIALGNLKVQLVFSCLHLSCNDFMIMVLVGSIRG